MPDNHRKVLSEGILLKFESMYNIVLNEDANTIDVCIAYSKRITPHKADEKFSINCKSLKRKITFSLDVIDIWKNLQKDKRYKHYSLFRVNNAANKLKAMYQTVDVNNVLHMLKIEFNGIKRI